MTRNFAAIHSFICSKPILSSIPIMIVCALASHPAAAQSLSYTAAQVSFLPTVVQLPTEDAPVRGFSLNLYYGVQPSVSGLQVGLINEEEAELKGVDLGMVSLVGKSMVGVDAALVSYVEEEVTGAQLGMWSNQAKGKLTGAQFGLGNGAASGQGVQLGIFSSGGSEFVGGQLGAVGLVTGKLRGAQLNAAASIASEECSGLQMGMLFNYSASGRCLQIGLVNWNPKGFLPYFPLFNYSR